MQLTSMVGFIAKSQEGYLFWTVKVPLPEGFTTDIRKKISNLDYINVVYQIRILSVNIDFICWNKHDQMTMGVQQILLFYIIGTEW